MKRKYDLAKTLRKTLTPPENLLWERLRNRFEGGPVFRRQYAFGPYIFDFYCPKARLAVEVDGYHHTEDSARQRDAVRDNLAENKGIMTLRIPAPDIYRDLDGLADGVWDLAISRMNGRK